MSRTIPILLILFYLFTLGAPVRASAGSLPDDWHTFESEHVVVHVPTSQKRAGKQFAADSDEIMAELMALTGLDEAPETIHAYLAPRRDVFAEIQPGDPPEWAAGTAYPERALVFVLMATRGEKTPRQVYVHELTHVVLHWSFGDNEPPRWLEEGITQVTAREFDLRTQTLLSQAALGGQLMPLSTLTDGFPDDPYRARVAYAESRDFLLYLRHEFGDQTVATIVQAMAAGDTAEQAIEGATGFSLRTLEQRWASRLNKRYAWLPVLGGSGTVWSVAAVLVVLGWARKRRQKRQRLQEMEEAERAIQSRRELAWDPDAGRRPLWDEDDRRDRERTVH